MKPIEKILRRLVLAAFVGASLFLPTKNGTLLFSFRAAWWPKLNVENAPVARENRPELSFASVMMRFYGVGQWHEDFNQTSDAEVTDLLEREKSFRAAPKVAGSVKIKTEGE